MRTRHIHNNQIYIKKRVGPGMVALPLIPILEIKRQEDLSEFQDYIVRTWIKIVRFGLLKCHRPEFKYDVVSYHILKVLLFTVSVFPFITYKKKIE